VRDADQPNHLGQIAAHQKSPSPQASSRRATKPALIIGVKRYAHAGECGTKLVKGARMIIEAMQGYDRRQGRGLLRQPSDERKPGPVVHNRVSFGQPRRLVRI
jgi:hypothetical protein